jgi:malonyl CoA-acyl carrier protein transacylase
MTGPVHAGETAFLYPTGGYHWPGMGSDVETSPWRDTLDRAERALDPIGVTAGALRRLMAGENQARRDRTATGWTWAGDFPLSMVAQLALGVALSRAHIDRHGPPRLLAGESMGELAAYCVAGALPLEDAARLAYLWARDLAAVSHRLGLRMAVVEDLEEAEFATVAPSCAAHVVVSESRHLFVAALPADRLDELDRAVLARGGHTLVSNNPCAAHEPRLAEARETWAAHERLLDSLPFAVPEITLLSTLVPGELLGDGDALRRNRVDTTFHRVRWGETLARLPEFGVTRVVQFGPASSGYAFRKLRGEEPALAHLRLRLVSTLSAATGSRTGTGAAPGAVDYTSRP